MNITAQSLFQEANSSVAPIHAVDVDYASLEAAAADVDGVFGALTDLEDVACSLEALAEVASTSIEQGGLDTTGAALLNMGAAHQMRRLGVEDAETVSVESFGGSSSRVEATQVSIETLGEQAKKIWDTIIAALKKAWEAIKAFFGQADAIVSRLEAKAAELAQRAGAAKGEPKEAAVTVPGKAKSGLVVDGKLEQDLGSYGVKLIDAAREMNSFYGACNDLSKELQGKEKGDAFDAAQKAGNEKLVGLLEKVISGGKVTEKDGKVHVIGETMHGNRALALVYSKENPVKAVMSLLPVADAKKFEGEKVDTLAPAEIKKLAGEVKNGAAAVKTIASLQKAIETGAKEIGKQVGEAAKDGGKNALHARWIQRNAVALQSGASAVAKAGIGQLLSITKGQIALCEASLKQYGEEKKDEK